MVEVEQRYLIYNNMLESCYNTQGLTEAGCDEAGRGCLAGSVYAAAVILPPGYENEELNDSKQLSARRRYALRERIQHDALAWAVGVVTAEEIDQINILNASFLAMHRALDQLRSTTGVYHCGRKPLYTLRRSAARNNRKGRWEVSVDCSSLGIGQNLSRRLYAPTAQGLPLLWLGHQCRLPDEGTLQGHLRARIDTLSPPKLRRTRFTPGAAARMRSYRKT